MLALRVVGIGLKWLAITSTGDFNPEKVGFQVLSLRQFQYEPRSPPDRTAALSGRFPGVFGADLLTGPARRRRKIALRRPVLSGPPDLADLVRNSKT